MGIEINKRLIEVKPGSFIYEFQNSLSSDECKNIINRFEESTDDHYQGRVGQNFTENIDVKKSTDMVISGKDQWKDADELFFTSLSKDNFQEI